MIARNLVNESGNMAPVGADIMSDKNNSVCATYAMRHILECTLFQWNTHLEDTHQFDP